MPRLWQLEEASSCCCMRGVRPGAWMSLFGHRRCEVAPLRSSTNSSLSSSDASVEEAKAVTMFVHGWQSDTVDKLMRATLARCRSSSSLSSSQEDL
eukprot:s6648_g2.t1